jgi:hypothetical protein
MEKKCVSNLSISLPLGRRTSYAGNLRVLTMNTCTQLASKNTILIWKGVVSAFYLYVSTPLKEAKHLHKKKQVTQIL